MEKLLSHFNSHPISAHSCLDFKRLYVIRTPTYYVKAELSGNYEAPEKYSLLKATWIQYYIFMGPYLGGGDYILWLNSSCCSTRSGIFYFHNSGNWSVTCICVFVVAANVKKVWKIMLVYEAKSRVLKFKTVTSLRPLRFFCWKLAYHEPRAWEKWLLLRSECGLPYPTSTTRKWEIPNFIFWTLS